MRKVTEINGWIGLLLVSLIWSCSENDLKVTRLNYGTSFGMCIGYCRNEITLEPGFVSFTKSGWQDTIKTITCRTELDNESWNYFKSDLNISGFLELPETIGCPDCADGGAEWLEVELANGEVHKVTFEYGNPPDIIKVYADSLREQMRLASQCGD